MGKKPGVMAKKQAAAAVFKKRCPEISPQSDYRRRPPKSFWKSFPVYRCDGKLKESVDVKSLRNLINKSWFSWDAGQSNDAKSALRILTTGGRAATTKPLGPVKATNAKSAYEFGEMLTDPIASWVKNKMVAGPYNKAPLPGFRSNPLMAVAQKSKIWPMMNLSGPKGDAFNEAVDPTRLKKLTMSSAKLFGQSLKRAGRGAVFANYDITEAYKLIPAAKDQWKNFGFRWLGKWFYDKTTVFGSKTAPDNFDYLPETLVNLTCTASGQLLYRRRDRG